VFAGVPGSEAFLNAWKTLDLLEWREGQALLRRKGKYANKTGIRRGAVVERWLQH